MSSDPPETPERPWPKRLYDALRRGAEVVAPFLPVLSFVASVASLLKN